MIALAVLVTGIAAVFGMVVHVKTANRTLLMQTRSLDAYARLAAQIQNAQCDYNPLAPPALGSVDTALTDPGLVPTPAPGTWIDASNRDPNSLVDAVGRTGVDLPPTVPTMHVDYRVTGGLTTQIPVLDIEIRVREITNDPTIDALPGGYYVRTYPVRKMCNPRLDESMRGEYRP